MGGSLLRLGDDVVQALRDGLAQTWHCVRLFLCVMLCVLLRAVDAGVFGTAQLCVYGYGTVSQAPHSDTYPGLRVLKPGDRLPLKVMDPANNSNQPHALTASQPCQSAAAELQPV